MRAFLRPTTQAPDDAPVMPSPDEIKSAILHPVQKYVSEHTEIVTENRCPQCSALYASGSLLCDKDGADLIVSPELQAVVRRMTNDIGIFVRKYGKISVNAGRLVEIDWDSWEFDIRPWLARTRGIEVGKGGPLQQTSSVNVAEPGAS